MHTIIMWIGGITAGCGVLMAGLIVALARDNPAAGILTGLGIGGGLFLSGAMLYCFGAIVEHLLAIRQSTERQAALLEGLKSRAAAKAA